MSLESSGAGSPVHFRYAIFDLDGTLVDSYSAIHESLNAVLLAFSRPAISLERCRRMVGHGLEVLIAGAVGRENVAEGVHIFRERYRVVGPERTSLLHGADEVTAELRLRGVPLAIASNKPTVFSRQLLDALGLLDRFVEITGPDLGFAAKPAPGMVLRLLEDLGAPAAECLFVGDMPVDVETARAAGLKVAVLPTGSSTREELEQTRPDYLLTKLADVLELF